MATFSLFLPSLYDHQSIISSLRTWIRCFQSPFFLPKVNFSCQNFDYWFFRSQFSVFCFKKWSFDVFNVLFPSKKSIFCQNFDIFDRSGHKFSVFGQKICHLMFPMSFFLPKSQFSVKILIFLIVQVTNFQFYVKKTIFCLSKQSIVRLNRIINAIRLKSVSYEILIPSFTTVKVWIKTWNLDTISIIKKHIDWCQNRFGSFIRSLAISINLKKIWRQFKFMVFIGPFHYEIIAVNQWNSRTKLSNHRSLKWDQLQYATANSFLTIEGEDRWRRRHWYLQAIAVIGREWDPVDCLRMGVFSLEKLRND